MKRAGLLAAAVLIGGLVSLRAEDAAKDNPSKAAYLEALQLKLEHAAHRANQPKAGASSVVGLRGSQQEPLSKQLYWKDKPGSSPVTPQEVKAFRAAVEQARAGQTVEAIAALKAFLAKYPDSAMKPDVEETIRVLSETPTPSSTPSSSSFPSEPRGA